MRATPKKQTLAQRLDYQTRQLAEHQQAIDYLKKEVRDASKEIVELEEILNKVASKEPPVAPGPWKPKNNETVWYQEINRAVQGSWNTDNPYCKEYEEMDLVHPTEAAAEKEIKRRKVMKKLKDMAEAAGPITKTWYIISKYEGEWIPQHYEYYHQLGAIRFPTKTSAERAIKELGAELDVLL